MERIVHTSSGDIKYDLQRKSVKNINLRVKKDGKIYVSASPRVSVNRIDSFVESKAVFILRAQERLKKQTAANIDRDIKQKRFENGEVFYILGKRYELKVFNMDTADAGADAHSVMDYAYTAADEVSFFAGKKFDFIRLNTICSDGAGKASGYIRLSSDCIYLYTKYTDDTEKKRKLYMSFIDRLCTEIYSDILYGFYLLFENMGAKRPQLKLRDMKTRWGSCMPKKGIITLNKQLIEHPAECIEYVAMHELCHLIHADHSKQFYELLASFMPDWKQRKEMLNG